MSQREDRHEAQRWLETAADDLRAAQTLAAAEFYAHACFAAQQCAEKAAKALNISLATLYRKIPPEK